VLPEHERAQCLAHLAGCSRCREVVFLVQASPVAPAAPVLVPARPRQLWFRPLPLLAAAAAICVVLLGAWLYMRSRTGAPPRELAARITQAPSLMTGKSSESETSKPVVRKAIPLAPRRSKREPGGKNPSPASATMPEAPSPTTAPLPPSAESANRASVSTPQVNVPPPPKPAPAVIQPEVAAVAASSGISGTVTDPTGAAVPQATVQLRQLAGNSTINTRTDPAGQFKFADLAPGQYELQITAPGFRLTSQRVEVRAQEVAAVKSELQVGSVAETVEVTAGAPGIQTESASVSAKSRRAAPAEPRPLPSKLLAETIVRSGKVMVALDSAGALFYSGNSGKGWKAVKPQWSGKIVDLVTPPEVPEPGSAQFQLTTDSGSDWLSRDGRRWYPAPPKH
jgi:hypothetical protein